MPVPEIPHFALPLRFVAGQAVYTEQDSVEEIANTVEAVLRFRPGDRPDIPEFGTPEQTFLQGGADVDEVERAIGEWEPRADTFLEGDLDPINEALARVSVEVFGA